MANESLVAACGLYCGACRAYLNNKCPGCKNNVKAEKWCKVKICCKENNFKSCADCKMFEDVKKCKKFNNIFSKLFALFLGSNRQWCVNRIRQKGYTEFAKEMDLEKNYNGKGKK